MKMTLLSLVFGLTTYLVGQVPGTPSATHGAGGVPPAGAGRSAPGGAGEGIKLPFDSKDEVAVFLKKVSSVDDGTHTVQIRMWLCADRTKKVVDAKLMEKTSTHFWVSPKMTVNEGQAVDYTGKKTDERRSPVTHGADLNEKLRTLVANLKQIHKDHPEIPFAPKYEFKIRLDQLDSNGKVVQSSYLYTPIDLKADSFNAKGTASNQIKIRVGTVEADFDLAVVRKPH